MIIPCLINQLCVLSFAQWSPVEVYLCMQREAVEMFLREPGELLRTLLLKSWFEVAIVHRCERIAWLLTARYQLGSQAAISYHTPGFPAHNSAPRRQESISSP